MKGIKMAWVWTITVIYLLGFIIIFMLNLSVGPVTPALSFVRAVVWPYFVMTGKPAGERARIMDE